MGPALGDEPANWRRRRFLARRGAGGGCDAPPASDDAAPRACVARIRRRAGRSGVALSHDGVLRTTRSDRTALLVGGCSASLRDLQRDVETDRRAGIRE